MRYSVVALGIVALIAGIAFYAMPTPLPKAQPGSGAETAYRAEAVLPRILAAGAMILGTIAIILGIILPSRPGHIPNAPYDAARARYSQYIRRKGQQHK
jgi:formate hydrogenlyase subunit 3/multisubunit Na+/H+ antiporter MnhD subunit